MVDTRADGVGEMDRWSTDAGRSKRRGLSRRCGGMRLLGLASAVCCAAAGASGAGCASTDEGSTPSSVGASVRASEVVIATPPGVERPPFVFSSEDEAFLEEVQYGAFRYLWEAGDPATGMPPDRLTNTVVSVAGVGFLLTALPVAVERGWVTREAGEARAMLILRSLGRDPAIRKAGLFQHFIDGRSAGIHPDPGLEHVVSTIDSALLFAGMLTASSYFGGEVATRADAFFEEADWRFFVGGDEAKPHERGFVSLGWKPTDKNNPSGGGEILPFYWVDSGCEHRLTTFLGVCAPRESHRLAPETYYRLRRQLGAYEAPAGAEGLPADLDRSTGLLSWFPYSGSLFVNTFSHLWLDYGAMGPDSPAAFGQPHRASIDWWENSRRVTTLHRLKAIENPRGLPTLGADAWGLTASDYPGPEGKGGYLVAGVFPRNVALEGARAGFDFSTFEAPDAWGDGTIAPYGPGCAILFQPRAAVRSLRWIAGLKREDGTPLVWRDPRRPKAEGGGYGFLDAFNLRGPGGKPWAAEEYLAIDQGPLLLAIENARTGRVWTWFHQHRFVRAGMERLKLERRR